jgi:hypothetical protein
MSKKQRTQKSQRAITRRDRFCSEQGLFKRTDRSGALSRYYTLLMIERRTLTVRRAACKPTRACLAGWLRRCTGMRRLSRLQSHHSSVKA